MSPKKKKMKKSAVEPNDLKRANESEGSSSKRSKTVKNLDEELQAQRRKNFVTACEQVSFKAYFDHRARLLLIYLPSCINNGVCKQHDSNSMVVQEMLSHAEEAFMIDVRANMWWEALEVCTMCITDTQYLSSNVLKEVVEIMLNAHEDEYAGYPVSHLVTRCQQILMQNFSTHPPCLIKRLRLCYNNFLTTPLDQKEETFTNRDQFGYDKGVVKYCMNRLEYEISSESKEESLVDKYENIPEEMKQSVKGLHWQKEKFEIYEVLERKERIDRLMAVLECIIELLQFDLAIWHCRYTNNLGTHIMRSHKPLMAYILWSKNILYTGTVNNNCRQILRIFAQLVHLQHPEEHIRIMTIWLNAVIQTFYICETNSNSDYPNTGKYCTAFANEFYKIIAEMPHDSIIRIMEMIKPTYMKHIIGILHLKKLLSTEEDCVIRNLIDFIKHSRWQKFPKAESDIKLSKSIFPKHRNFKRTMKLLTKKCIGWNSIVVPETIHVYPKMEPQIEKGGKVNCNNVVQTLYVTLEAYLDAYNVQNVQETLDSLNEKLGQHDEDDSNVTNNILPELNSYTVSEQFIKKYRSIYQMLKELVLLLQELKNSGEFPEILRVFEKIDLLGL